MQSRRPEAGQIPEEIDPPEAPSAPKAEIVGRPKLGLFACTALFGPGSVAVEQVAKGGGAHHSNLKPGFSARMSTGTRFLKEIAAFGTQTTWPLNDSLSNSKSNLTFAIYLLSFENSKTWIYEFNFDQECRCSAN